MESKYDKARYNKTYYEKNKEKLRELQRQKRQKMKEALQKVEAEEQETRTESQEPEGLSKNFSLYPIFPSEIWERNFPTLPKSMLFKAAVSGSLVASQAAYRALKKTIENKQSSTPTPSVSSFNPLD